MRYFLDTEFAEDGCTIDLISIGIVAEDGRMFYREVSPLPANVNPWVKENVLPHLVGRPHVVRSHSGIRRDLVAFIGDDTPEFWGRYCVAPFTKVLTADLRWVRIDSLGVGDRLMAFDETASPGTGRSSRWRCWREGRVESIETIERPSYDLTFEDGTHVRCSSDHRWLTYNQKAAQWLTTESLQCRRGAASNVVKPVDVWESDCSRGGGYLAAAFDGEGYLTQTDLADKPRGVFRFRIGFSQKGNPMLGEVERLLDRGGYRVAQKRPVAPGVQTLMVGNRREVLRFLGSVRPVRLLAAFEPGSVGAMSLRSVKLVNKTAVGIQPVVSIRTDTGTYIAEGLASHNCDYDWVVLCQLFGPMVDLPEGWPKLCLDLKQEEIRLGNPTIPEQDQTHGAEHNALADARWNMHVFQVLRNVDMGRQLYEAANPD